MQIQRTRLTCRPLPRAVDSRRSVWVLLLLCGLALGGCVPEVRMDLPHDFVPLKEDDRGGYDVRGVSADGVVLAARGADNAQGGSLAFWTEAVRNELTASRGYTFESTEPIVSRAGTPGTLTTFSTRYGGAPARYIAAVFVRGEGLLVAEAGGKAEAVAGREAVIREAIRSVR